MQVLKHELKVVVIVVVVDSSSSSCCCCVLHYYARPHRAEALSDDARLTSVCRVHRA